jgi:hypothetical protein
MKMKKASMPAALDAKFAKRSYDYRKTETPKCSFVMHSAIMVIHDGIVKLDGFHKSLPRRKPGI